MTLAGAPPALRGFRRQHLYALFRLLTDASRERYSIQLEGTEDLEIFDESGHLIEAIQVKARESAPLTPSRLRSKDDSFFIRAKERLRSAPESLQHVVSFGDVGLSLRLLESPSDDARDALKVYGLDAGEADAFSAAFRVTEVSEADIERVVLDQLSATVTSANADVAFLYLSGWLARATEDRRRVTAADVQARLLAVGQYIAEEAAHHEEWFRTIRPLIEREIDATEREKLAQQFYDGVSARFDHVLAGVDVRRDAKLRAIESGFQASNVVVIHGASGQGKTALACRYLLEAPPSTWRFEIAELQDIRHARNVILALQAHARIGVRTMVWLDATPRATAWAQVVDGIRDLEDVQVLVTIREEDWTRAKNAGVTLSAAEIDLALDKEEAALVFADLQRREVSGEFLDFADAWTKFGGAGPLMEFTYLVTKGEALGKTLDSQIRRLKEDVRRGELQPAELDLLRRIAVASSVGGRVRLPTAVADLGLALPSHTLELFEKEYLIRLSKDRLYAEGLHPLRSQLTADLLTRDELDPSWSEAAIAAMASLDEADLEAFLLHGFARRSEAEAEAILLHVRTFKPETMTGAVGVVRALLWRGIQRYRAQHGAILEEIRVHVGGAEIAWGILDPAGLKQFIPGFSDNFDTIFGMVPSQREWYADVQSRIPSNEPVFEEARAWLGGAGKSVLATPSSDWSAVAEMLFWAIAWNVVDPAAMASATQRLTASQTDVSLETCADFVFALSFQSRDARPEAFESLRQTLIARFQEESATFAIDIDDGEVMAYYVMSPAPSAPLDLHGETIRRVDVLRRLFPDESTFGARACGVAGMAIFAHDPSEKKGIPKQSFPVPWATRLHLLFSHAARVYLPWGEYAKAILELRQRVVALARDVVSALRKYFNRDKPKHIFELGANLDEWLALNEALRRLPKPPNAAVDELGYEVRLRSEARTVDPRDEIGEFLKALYDYANALSDFMSAAIPYLRANPDLGRPSPDGIERAQALLEEHAGGKTPHLPTWRLADAVKALRRFQDEFRSRFGRFAQGSLPSLEDEEQTWLWNLWAVWYQFAYDPRQYPTDATRESRAKIDQVISKYRRELTRRLEALTQARSRIHAEIDRWSDGAGLWVVLDVDTAADTDAGLAAVIATTIDTLRPPPDFEAVERYALDLVWGEVHFVGLIRGKALEPTRRTLMISTLPQPDDELPGWRLLPLPIDDSVWTRLGIPLHPQTLAETARNLRAEIALAVAEVEALLGIDEAPPPTGVGTVVLQEHWSNATSELIHRLQRSSEIAEMLPVSLFDDGAESVRNLMEFLATLRRMIEEAEPMSFEPLTVVRNNLTPQLLAAVDGIVIKAVDNELIPA